MMDRRVFFGSLGFLAMPVVAGAQPAGKVWRVGLVWETVPAASQPLFEPLRQALANLDYVEGRSIVFDQRWAEGRRERVPELIAELVREKVDLLALPSNPLIAAGKQATRDIPIVMLFSSEPVGRVDRASTARSVT